MCVQKSPSAAFTRTPRCLRAGCSCPGSSGTVRLPELRDTCPASAGEDGERGGDLLSLYSYAKVRFPSPNQAAWVCLTGYAVVQRGAFGIGPDWVGLAVLGEPRVAAVSVGLK